MEYRPFRSATGLTRHCGLDLSRHSHPTDLFHKSAATTSCGLDLFRHCGLDPQSGV